MCAFYLSQVPPNRKRQWGRFLRDVNALDAVQGVAASSFWVRGCCRPLLACLLCALVRLTLLTHSRTRSLTHSLTHSLLHSLTPSLTHSLTHSTTTHSLASLALSQLIRCAAVRSMMPYCCRRSRMGTSWPRLRLTCFPRQATARAAASTPEEEAVAGGHHYHHHQQQQQQQQGSQWSRTRCSACSTWPAGCCSARWTTKRPTSRSQCAGAQRGE